MMEQPEEAAGQRMVADAQAQHKHAQICLLNAQQRKCEAVHMFSAARTALLTGDQPAAKAIGVGATVANSFKAQARLQLAKSVLVVAQQNHDYTGVLLRQAREECWEAQLRWEQTTKDQTTKE